jgi:hypothetical protein
MKEINVQYAVSVIHEEAIKQLDAAECYYITNYKEKLIMNIKAIDIFNILKQYSESELKKLDIVIEIGRTKHNQLGKSEYATIVEEYPSQIRIANKE